MYFKSKNFPLLILGITAIVCSRTMFVFFDDPEGPNLLIVVVMAANIYFLSLAVYLSVSSTKNVLQRLSLLLGTGPKRLLLAIVIQVLVATMFYFCLYL